ncbi:GlsB/YeaQ/YmgE family stress response membrane protein [Novosphingobium sp.]|uniref:GlsB/YeaQ/YmgE family stress response membrane protein n=1 Tax=Novosphingobium sp. TaxID=1874826 RepID=UPI002FDE3DD0
MRDIISMLISGLLVGLVARFLYPGAIEMGWARTILLGIGGALVAGLASSLAGRGTVSEGFNRAGCLASILGAMLLIFLGRHFW